MVVWVLFWGLFSLSLFPFFYITVLESKQQKKSPRYYQPNFLCRKYLLGVRYRYTPLTTPPFPSLPFLLVYSTSPHIHTSTHTLTVFTKKCRSKKKKRGGEVNLFFFPLLHFPIHCINTGLYPILNLVLLVCFIYQLSPLAL